jgi:hypothetical protein
MEEEKGEISKELVSSITSRIKDGDIINQAAFLLFSLAARYPAEESLIAVSEFLKPNGWLLKTEDKEFIHNISQKSMIDIRKWIDFNMKRAY